MLVPAPASKRPAKRRAEPSIHRAVPLSSALLRRVRRSAKLVGTAGILTQHSSVNVARPANARAASGGGRDRGALREPHRRVRVACQERDLSGEHAGPREGPIATVAGGIAHDAPLGRSEAPVEDRSIRQHGRGVRRRPRGFGRPVAGGGAAVGGRRGRVALADERTAGRERNEQPSRRHPSHPSEGSSSRRRRWAAPRPLADRERRPRVATRPRPASRPRPRSAQRLGTAPH